MTVALVSQSRWAAKVPLEVRWTQARVHGPGERPLPVRVIRSPRSQPRALPVVFHPELRHLNGQANDPFDFTEQMRRLCRDIVARCSCFHPIDLDRVLISVSRARTARASGLQAKVVPLRFRGGLLTRSRRGRTFRIQRYWMNGIEILYLMSFCLPRFLNQSFDDKMITVFHELYHVAPEFDGDLRRHGGRYCVHTHSKKGYDRQMASLAREYLQNGADAALHAFLRLDFNQLRQRHGQVIGTVAPMPKLVLLD